MPRLRFHRNIHIPRQRQDRKSTRLNSSHSQISYAVFCLKKKKKNSYHVCLFLHTHLVSPHFWTLGSFCDTFELMMHILKYRESLSHELSVILSLCVSHIH